MDNKLKAIKYFTKDNIKWIMLFVCIVCILFLIEDVMDKDIAAFDEQGYLFVSQNLISDTMTPIAKFITNFANAIFLIVLSAFLLIVIKNKKIGKLIFINLGVSALVNFTLKQILQRPRPTDHMIVDESGYSFPSGHSMVSMAFYGFLIYLIYKNISNKYLKYGLIALLFTLIMSIGISRIYLGVHYPSDVIAGFLVAIAYLIVFIHIVGLIKGGH